MAAERYRPQRNWGARVLEYDYQGMRAVFLENETLRVGVLAGKGTDLFEFNYKPRDVDFIWLTPGGVRSPTAYLPTSPDPSATFTDFYLGGWQEILPNGGVPSSAFGAQFGQHGEVTNLPWDYQITEDREEAVAVTFRVRGQKSPFLLEKRLRLRSGASRLEIDETLINEGNVPVSAMWGHHITFGRPFAGPGCRVRVPEGAEVVVHNPEGRPSGRRVRTDRSYAWPLAEGEAGEAVDLSVLPPAGEPSEMLYLRHLSEGWYEVENPQLGLGFRVEWDLEQMPYLWYWQEFGASRGYPWYGRAYVIGLEPFSSYPTFGLGAALADGNVLTLEPGERRSFWLRASVVAGASGGA